MILIDHLANPNSLNDLGHLSKKWWLAATPPALMLKNKEHIHLPSFRLMRDL